MSDTNNNKANEPYEDYNQPLTFEKVWMMFQETNRLFKDIEERFKETDKQFKETDRRLDKLSRLYGGVSENSKDVAEEFFKQGLKTRDSLFGIPYNEVSHLERASKRKQGEYDIVLHDGEHVIVIEVKYKLHPKDVNDFMNRKLHGFKDLFHEYAHKKIIGCVAGMSVPSESAKLAMDKGLLVLTQSGESIAILNHNVFKPKVY